MLTNSIFKCEKCKCQAEYSLLDKKYCKKHYIIERFGTNTIHGYLDMYKISHTHHVLDNHIILPNRNEKVLELCNLLGLVCEEDYWFGKGMIGFIDCSDVMHIKEKADNGKRKSNSKKV